MKPWFFKWLIYIFLESSLCLCVIGKNVFDDFCQKCGDNGMRVTPMEMKQGDLAKLVFSPALNESEPLCNALNVKFQKTKDDKDTEDDVPMSARTESMAGRYEYIGLQNSSNEFVDTAPSFRPQNGSHVYMKEKLVPSKANEDECIAIITECFHAKRNIWMGRMISVKEIKYWKTRYGNDSIPSLCMFWKHAAENTENPCSGSPIISNLKLDESKVDYTKCNGTGIASLTCLGPKGLQWYLLHDTPEEKPSTTPSNGTTPTPSDTTVDSTNETASNNETAPRIIKKISNRANTTKDNAVNWGLIDIECVECVNEHDQYCLNSACFICSQIPLGYKKLSGKHCDHQFHGEEINTTLRHAILLCLYDNECDKIFDHNCDDKPPFKMCKKNGLADSTIPSEKSCVYEKNDRGYEVNCCKKNRQICDNGILENGLTCPSIMSNCEYDVNIRNKCRKTCDTCPKNCEWSEWEESDCLPRCAEDAKRKKNRTITKAMDPGGICEGNDFIEEACDESTEAFCTNSFACKNGKDTIPIIDKCNGDEDCDDGSDEEGCDDDMDEDDDYDDDDQPSQAASTIPSKISIAMFINFIIFIYYPI